MYKLLIVDDEEKIRSLIKKYALFEGYEVREAENGMKAVESCKSEDFDMIIMDIMMPELDGFSACKAIRKFSQTPVIMLSARDEEYDKIHGFELGIDDYVVKPFSPKEYELFFYLVKNRGVALKREQLINKVWGYDFYGSFRLYPLNVFIKVLKHKI